MGAGEAGKGSLRDYVLVARIGGLGAFTVVAFDHTWFIAFGLAAGLVLMIPAQQVEARSGMPGGGITSEAAAVVSFFLGALATSGAIEIAIALAVVTLVALSQKERLAALRKRVERFELDATVKLLIIAFSVLPVLPPILARRLADAPPGHRRGQGPGIPFAPHRGRPRLGLSGGPGGDPVRTLGSSARYAGRGAGLAVRRARASTRATLRSAWSPVPRCARSPGWSPST